ncbi:MAG: hypothetical protein ABH952_12745 [Candidatus Omnitrophota bacterium]
MSSKPLINYDSKSDVLYIVAKKVKKKNLLKEIFYLLDIIFLVL